jgi:hypothetical protein
VPQSHRRTVRWNLLFFAAGFVFDVYATSAGAAHTLIVVQQIAYLAIIGGILAVDFVHEAHADTGPTSPRQERLWRYSSFVFHFCLGTLMNLYSIFFLMSASLFSSIVFVVILFGAIALNELATERRRGLDVKVAFYIVCLFCFWSLLIPIALGRINRLTFYLSFAFTLAAIAFFYQVLRRRIPSRVLNRRLVMPGVSVSILFLLLYQAGLIPPVPIAAKRLGVYHQVEHVGDSYELSHEAQWWRPWRTDDRQFIARPGDVVHAFFAIYSPTRFDDTVFVRWSIRDRALGWQDADRIPIHITGGRREGFRGVATKANYSAGDWRITVETTGGQEIARLSFTITSADADPNRVFKTTVY